MPYFNAASHGLPDPNVYAAMADFLKKQAQSKFDQEPDEADKIIAAKKSVASLLSARPDQLGFTSTTTSAWHVVVGALDLSGKRVLVTEHEWGDYYRLLAKRSDVEIQILPPLDFTNPDLSSWQQAIDTDVAAIFVPFVTSIAGYRYPVENICALARPQGTKLVLDAAQALGQTEVNAAELNCDAIVSTCRKWMRGPRQTALFWMNDHWTSQGAPISAPALAPADQNAALMIGLGQAARNILQQPKHQLRTQANDLRHWATTNEISVYGADSAQSSIVSLVFDMTELEAVDAALRSKGITAKIITRSHAEPLQRGHNTPQKLLRLSAHVYNSDVEIQHLKEAVLTAL